MKIDTSQSAFPKPDVAKERRQRTARKKKRRQKFWREVMELDRFTCQNRKCCFIYKRHHDWVEAHHIIFRSSVGKDTIENGITLCAKCHNRAHHGANELTGRQFMLMILEDRLGSSLFRWGEAYETLKRNEG